MLSRTLAKAVVRDLVVLAALAVVGELGLRALAPQYGHKIYDNNFTGSYPIALNAEKYRGEAQPVQKPAGQLRVLALGDSETFGTGVRVDHTWPAHLQHILKTRRPESVVINGAVEGMSAGDIARAWEEKWRTYSPDVVAFGLSASMVSLAVARPQTMSQDELTSRYGEPPNDLSRLQIWVGRRVHSSYLVGFASTTTQRALYWMGLLDFRIRMAYPYGAVVAYGWQQGDIPPDLSKRAWAGLGAEFTKLANRVQSSGARVVLVWLAPRFELGNSCRDNMKNLPKERLSIDPAVEASALAHAANAQFVNTLPDLKEARRKATETGEYNELYIHFDDGHFDEQGNLIVAQAIARAL